MRRAFNQVGWLIGENETFVGCRLGFDHCAEHEWGVKVLWDHLGIHGDIKLAQGMPRFKMTEFDESIFHFEKDLLLCVSALKWLREDAVREGKSLELGNYKHTLQLYPAFSKEPAQELACAWDQSSFGIRALVKPKSRKPHPYLKALWEALQVCDIAVWQSGRGNPFGGAGLCVAIYSELPETGLATALACDQESLRVIHAGDETGIVERVKEAKLAHLSLFPKFWQEPVGATGRTKEILKFWLNPMDQRIYNSGWFTVKELDQWIAGKGPVLKKKGK